MSKHAILLSSLASAAAAAALTTAVLSQSAGPSADFASPGPEHKVLERLAGEWVFAVDLGPRQGREAESLELDVDYRWALGGRFLIGSYEGWINGERFTAREVLGYDRYRDRFESLWVDNTSTGFTTSTGTWDERNRTLTWEGVQDDPAADLKDQPFKITYRFDKSSEDFTAEVEHDRDGKMEIVTKVRATRPE